MIVLLIKFENMSISVYKFLILLLCLLLNCDVVLSVFYYYDLGGLCKDDEGKSQDSSNTHKYVAYVKNISECATSCDTDVRCEFFETGDPGSSHCLKWIIPATNEVFDSTDRRCFLKVDDSDCATTISNREGLTICSKCITGKWLTVGGSCESCPINYVCDGTNTKCPSGHTIKNAVCEDDDECTLGTHTCNLTKTVCLNNAGSFSCEDCKIQSGQTKCTTYSEQCITGTDLLKCEQCDLGYTGERCTTCDTGFTLVGSTCLDKDECTLGTHTCDLTKTSCFNNVGTFTCELCDCSGFIIDPNGHISQGPLTPNIYNCTHLNLSNCSIFTLDEDMFDGFFNYSLDLSNNNLTNIPPLIFEEANTILLDENSKCSSYGFTFENGILKKKKGPHYDYLDQCENIYLRDCGIKEIEPKCFVDAASLIKLDLSYNNFTNLRKEKFADNFYKNGTNLQKLLLSFNGVTKLNAKSFSSSLLLRLVNLSNNQIQLVENDAFPNDQLQLDLTQNPLECCSGGMRQLYQLLKENLTFSCSDIENVELINNYENICIATNQQSNNDDKMNMIVGVVVGVGVLAIIVCVCIGVYVYKKSKKKDLLNGKSAMAFVADGFIDEDDLNEKNTEPENLIDNGYGSLCELQQYASVDAVGIKNVKEVDPDSSDIKGNCANGNTNANSASYSNGEYSNVQYSDVQDYGVDDSYSNVCNGREDYTYTEPPNTYHY